MNLATRIILFASLIHLSLTRGLWEDPVAEISATLQKHKPIQVDNNSTKLQIVDLTDTLYSDSLSQLHNVTEVRILRNQLRHIEPAALCSSPNLKTLEVDLSRNKNPPLLTKEMFDGCDTLEELFLKGDYNEAAKIEDDALRNMSKLKTLGLDSLRVEHLGKFLKLTNNSLTRLIMSNLHIVQLDSNVFDDLTNLEELEIVHDIELTGLPKGLFKKTPKLKRLVLSDNKLQNLTWEEFEGLSSLEELDLFDNQITYLDASKIAKNLPKLKILFTEMNLLPCGHRKNFRKEIKEKFHRSVEVPERYPDLYISCDENN
jgi:Leucine-rich repeat (LRR) protein